ncbi:MAG: cobalamin B12-binding domain-containing protein [Geminicoccaceae bacterium]|nr:MAG: cobalamin B12-binding domain-containing protein [Geminicoccaceae bacterium]
MTEALRRAVIPALVQRHRPSPEARIPEPRVPEARVPKPHMNGHAAVHHVLAPLVDQAGELARLVLAPSEAEAAQFVERLCHAQGAEAVCHDVLEPAARNLGELWTADRVDFTQVTIGVWRLQRLARQLDTRLETRAIFGATPRALLLPTPGEQHSFGLYNVAAAFRRAGWLVMGGSVLPVEQCLQLAAAQRFDVVGFSLGAARHLEALRDLIREVRRRSANPQVRVLVGGPLFLAHPETLRDVGGDATARDGPEAVRQAQRFVALSSRP